MSEHDPIELLESTHFFPGSFQIKAIGHADDDFEGRILAAVQEELPVPGDLEHSVRSTPGGRHIALTLDINVQSAEQVLAIYARIREVHGLKLLF